MGKAYELFLESRAQKELDKLPTDIFARIDKAILGLSIEPRPFGVKKLDEKLYRIRVRDWRILFAIIDDQSQVVILRVVRRNEKTYKV